MASKKKLTKAEIQAVETGMFQSYDVRWLKQLRAEGDPHPAADHLIEEFDALVERYVPAKPVEDEELPETPEDEGENLEN